MKRKLKEELPAYRGAKTIVVPDHEKQKKEQDKAEKMLGRALKGYKR